MVIISLWYLAYRNGTKLCVYFFSQSVEMYTIVDCDVVINTTLEVLFGLMVMASD